MSAAEKHSLCEWCAVEMLPDTERFCSIVCQKLYLNHEREIRLSQALEAERAEHRRTAERWDEERRKWYAERERLIAQIACEVGSP